MKFQMKVYVIKIQPKFDFRLCRSKVTGHSSLNMRKYLIIYAKLFSFNNISNVIQ